MSTDRNVQLCRLAIAKLTTSPTAGTLEALKSAMTPTQFFTAQRLVNRIKASKATA